MWVVMGYLEVGEDYRKKCGEGGPKVNFSVFTILPDFLSSQMLEAVEYNPSIIFGISLERVSCSQSKVLKSGPQVCLIASSAFLYQFFSY